MNQPEFIELLNQINEKISPKLRQMISDNQGGGLCVPATRWGKTALMAQGMNVKEAGGHCLLSVNHGNHGIIDYSNHRHYPDELGCYESPGRKIGHFWLETDHGIVDFTLPHLKQIFLIGNSRMGIQDMRYQLPTKILIEPKDQSTYEAIMGGKIGWYYQKEEGRGHQVWNDKPSSLVLTGV